MPEPAGDRIAARLDALWRLRLGPAGGADRPAYSASEAAAMRLVAGWAAEAGLEPGIDAYGNVWAAPPGRTSVASSGSHVDTVPDGGRLDGALGTVLALEAAACLPGDAQPAVLVCAAEEASRFGAGTIGSRLLVGALEEAELERLRDADGVSAAAARVGYLRELDDLPRVEVPLDDVAGHVEVHVEQRRELSRSGVRLAVAERVAVPHRFELTVTGEPGHAGEVPMADRRDALAAAAELVLALETAARAAPAPTVATVGALGVEPGAVSVIPGRATLRLEVRGIDASAIAAVVAGLGRACDDVERRRGVRVERTRLRGGEPVALDPALAAAALGAAERRGARVLATHSGAGHDVQHLAARVPAGLLFVPLIGGESHSPHEDADPRDVALAAAVLIDVLGGLAGAERRPQAPPARSFASAAPERNSSLPNS